MRIPWDVPQPQLSDDVHPALADAARAAGKGVYVLVRTFQGQWRQVHPLMWGAALAFAIYFAIPIMQQEFSWI